MCEYCKEQKPIWEWEVGDKIYFAMASYAVVGDGKTIFTAINYCPMCGRKLAEE